VNLGRRAIIRGNGDHLLILNGAVDCQAPVMGLSRTTFMRAASCSQVSVNVATEEFVSGSFSLALPLNIQIPPFMDVRSNVTIWGRESDELLHRKRHKSLGEL
jgi:hypothetical protein